MSKGAVAHSDDLRSRVVAEAAFGALRRQAAERPGERVFGDLLGGACRRDGERQASPDRRQAPIAAGGARGLNCGADRCRAGPNTGGDRGTGLRGS